MFSRRFFVGRTFTCFGGLLIWTACRDEPVFLDGAVAPDGVEISGVLSVLAHDVAGEEPSAFEISGEGHTHMVPLASFALRRLRETGGVVVRSGPATSNAHRHWIRVKLET